MKQKRNQFIIILYILFSILYIVPSINSYVNYGGFYYFWEKSFESYFFINTYNHALLQATSYLAIVGTLYILFYLITKNASKIFQKKSSAFIMIFIVQVIFSIGAPINSSDLFCYLGVGRMYSEYKVNPYYNSIGEYTKSNDYKESDEVLDEGSRNFWADTKISYGPIHLFFYGLLSKLSNGKINTAVIIAKVVTIAINMLICELLYKFFDNKLSYVLLYGLNPFVIINTTINCHNDALFLLLILLAMYCIIKKDNLLASLLFLSLSVNMKFVSIIFLPYIVLYYCREKQLAERIAYCIVCAINFGLMTLIPWIPFYRDISVFNCIFDQIGRTCNSIYYLIEIYIPDYYNVIQKAASIVFVLLYVVYCFKMLFEKKFNVNKNMMILFGLLLFFLLVVTTNLQCWYFLWFYPFIYFSSKKDIVLIFAMQLMTVINNAFYIATNYAYDIILFSLFIATIVYFIISVGQPKKDLA